MKLYRYFTYKAYTLIELLLALSLVGIILCIAIPGWQLLLQNNNATMRVHGIITALEYTRILAIKQNKNIALCRRYFYDGTNSMDWSDGQVVVDPQKAKDEGILRFFTAVPKYDRLLWESSFNKNDCIVFTPLGVPAGQQGSFYYNYGKGHAAKSLRIVVQETGNIY